MTEMFTQFVVSIATTLSFLVCELKVVAIEIMQPV